jgi:hypothetical protein
VWIPKAETIVEESTGSSTRDPNQRSFEFEPEQPELDFRSRGQQLREKYGHLTREERLARIDELADENFNREVDNAIDNAVAHNLYELPGKNPSTGEGLSKITLKFNPNKNLTFQDNLTFKKIQGSPTNTTEVRTHSPNSNSLQGSYSKTNYTTQINSKNPDNIYRLPDGRWKPLSVMTEQELSDAHYK